MIIPSKSWKGQWLHQVPVLLRIFWCLVLEDSQPAIEFVFFFVFLWWITPFCAIRSHECAHTHTVTPGRQNIKAEQRKRADEAEGWGKIGRSAENISRPQGRAFACVCAVAAAFVRPVSLFLVLSPPTRYSLPPGAVIAAKSHRFGGYWLWPFPLVLSHRGWWNAPRTFFLYRSSLPGPVYHVVAPLQHLALFPECFL